MYHVVIRSVLYSNFGVSKSALVVMGGEENEQMGVGQDCVSFDVEKEYGAEED